MEFGTRTLLGTAWLGALSKSSQAALVNACSGNRSYCSRKTLVDSLYFWTFPKDEGFRFLQPLKGRRLPTLSVLREANTFIALLASDGMDRVDIRQMNNKIQFGCRSRFAIEVTGKRTDNRILNRGHIQCLDYCLHNCRGVHLLSGAI